MARKHTLKLRELRKIRFRFILILAGMTTVTLLLIAYLAVRIFVLREPISYFDFASLSFYAIASVIMTLAQIAFLHQLNVGPGRRLEEMTYSDELTGLGNRRHIAHFLADEFREAQLSKNPLSLLCLDLDGFKHINDQHGHSAGDLVLRAVSHAVQSSIRDTDFAGRAGGDEFIVILPDTDSQCASVVAHRIAERVAGIAIKLAPASIDGLTTSIGITSYPVNAATTEALVEDADRTMYAAKNSGHGHIIVSIARASGPAPKRPPGQVTTLATRIEEIVERKGAPVAGEKRLD